MSTAPVSVPGVCRACKNPIPRARLEAKPKAAYCVGCQEELEAETPIRRRGRHDSSGVVLLGGETFEPVKIE